MRWSLSPPLLSIIALAGSLALSPRCGEFEFPEQLVEQSNLLAKEGRSGDALECLLGGIGEFEHDPDVWDALGALYAELGSPDPAAEALWKAYQLRPHDAGLALRLGNALAGLGRDAEALGYFREASDLRPESAVPHNNMGLAMARMGNVDGALEAYQRGLGAPEEDPSGRCMVMVNLGFLEGQLGRTGDALARFRGAIGACRSVEARINAGSLLLDEGSFAAAEEVLRGGGGVAAGEYCRVLARMLAVALGMQDKIDEAAGSIRNAGEAGGCGAGGSIAAEAAHSLAQRGQPLAGIEMWSRHGLSSAEDFYHAAGILESAHDAVASARAYSTAQRLDGSHYRATAGLAVLQYRHAKFRVAEDLYRRAAREIGDADPESLAEVLHGLGASIEMTHSRLDEAATCFERSLELQPGGHNTFFSLLHLRGRLCDWTRWQEMIAEARALLDKGISGGLGPIFALAYPLSDEQMCTLTRIRAGHTASGMGDAAQHFFPWQPRYAEPVDRLAISVISADFNMKPVGQLVRSVFGMMDRTRFQVFCFSLEGSDGSPIVVQIASECGDFQFVNGLDTLTIANRINAEQTHILLDITGYTDGGRVEVGALKPAPVAVNYLALPHTYALDGYDYVLTDRVVTPPEMHASCFVERFVFLPGPCYMVNDYRQSALEQVMRPPLDVSEAAALGVPHRHDGRVVLANFNHLQKLGPETFDLWVTVLASCATCVLWLLRFPPQAEKHLRREMEARSRGTATATTGPPAGVPHDALVFTGKFANDEHIRVKGAASVLLDTLEYNAHVSGLDALWAGLPLVTLSGSNMARRCGASFLLALGIPETLARTPDEYVAVTETLTRDSVKLEGIRGRVVAGRHTGGLFDTRGWVAGFQRALTAMWEVRVASSDTRQHIVLTPPSRGVGRTETVYGFDVRAGTGSGA